MRFPLASSFDAAYIRALIIGTARDLGLDPDLALRQATAESGLNPAAVSPCGAIGVFQLMPATAHELGANPHDVQQNIRAGLTYMHQLLRTFRTIDAALAAYNWGPGHLMHCMRTYGDAWARYLPVETKNYLLKILGGQSGLQHQAKP